MVGEGLEGTVVSTAAECGWCMSGHTPCPCCVCAKPPSDLWADLPRPVDRHGFQAFSLAGRGPAGRARCGRKGCPPPLAGLPCGALQQATPGPLMPSYGQPNPHWCRDLVGTPPTLQTCGRLASVQPGQPAGAARQGGTSWASHVGSLARSWPGFGSSPACRLAVPAECWVQHRFVLTGWHRCVACMAASGTAACKWRVVCCSDQRRAHCARGNHQNGGIHSMQHNGMLLQFCAEAGCRIFGVLIFCAGTVLCSLWRSQTQRCASLRGAGTSATYHLCPPGTGSVVVECPTVQPQAAPNRKGQQGGSSRSRSSAQAAHGEIASQPSYRGQPTSCIVAQ